MSSKEFLLPTDFSVTCAGKRGIVAREHEMITNGRGDKVQQVNSERI